MTRDTAIREYCHGVNRTLEVPGRRKRELVTGLRRELEERFPDAEVLTLEELTGEIGTIGETADALMETVHPEERGRHRTRQKRLTCLIIAGLALLLAASVALFIYTERNQTVRAEQTIIVHPTIYEGSE